MKVKVQNNFEEIIIKHQQKIYKFIFSFVKNENDTDEIAQQTFFNAFKGYKKFRGESSVDTWLIKIAINNIRTHFRKKKFFSIFKVLDNEEIEIKDLKDDSKSAEEVVKNKMISNKINKAIEDLPARQKEVFVMKHIDGLSISEIADILEIAEGSVKASIFKAINNLRKLLGGIDEL
ncbi:MAG TPA: RNA polymerase subunit sigma-70 [Elusimicrobia bacterium]|nr:RNA polymerase subunit sigma-70 [Elusimicrobiota bacterium]